MPRHPGIKRPRSAKIGVTKSKPKRKSGPRRQRMKGARAN